MTEANSEEEVKHVSQCDLFALTAPGKPVYWTGYPGAHRMPSSDSPEDCHMKGRQESALHIWLDMTPYTHTCIGDPPPICPIKGRVLLS